MLARLSANAGWTLLFDVLKARAWERLMVIAACLPYLKLGACGVPHAHAGG